MSPLRSCVPLLCLATLLACTSDDTRPADAADTHGAEVDTTPADAPDAPDDTDPADTADPADTPDPGDTADPDTSPNPTLVSVALDPATVPFDAPGTVTATLELSDFDVNRDLARLTITSSLGQALTPTLASEGCPADRLCVAFSPPPMTSAGRLALTFALGESAIEVPLGLRAPAHLLTGELPAAVPVPELGEPLGSLLADVDGDDTPELLALHRPDTAMSNGLTITPPILVTIYGVKPARLLEPIGSQAVGEVAGGEGDVTVYASVSRPIAILLDGEARDLDVTYLATGRRARSPSGALELAVSLEPLGLPDTAPVSLRLPTSHTFVALVPELPSNATSTPGLPWVMTSTGEGATTRLHLHRFPEAGVAVTSLELPLPEGLAADLASGRRGHHAQLLTTTDPTNGVVRRTLDLVTAVAPGENWCGDVPHLRVLQVRAVLGEVVTAMPLTCREIPELTQTFSDTSTDDLALRVERLPPLAFTDGRAKTDLELAVLGAVITLENGDLEARYRVEATWRSEGLAPRTELLFEGRGHAPPRFGVALGPTADGTGTCQHLAISGHEHRLGDFVAHLPGPYCDTVEPTSDRLIASAAPPTGASRYWNIMDWDRETRPSSCGHYTQQVWANTSRVGCGAPPPPTIRDGEDLWSVEGELVVAAARPSMAGPFEDEPSTGGRALLSQHAFEDPAGGHWLAATVSGPLRDLGPDAEGPRLHLGEPELWLLRLDDEGALLGATRVPAEGLGARPSLTFHPSSPEQRSANRTQGYLGFRGQPIAFAPGRSSARLMRVEATPGAGPELSLALVEVASVDLPGSSSPWQIRAVGVEAEVPWLVASAEVDGQLSLARLSCCEGCAPDLSVAPVGPTQSTDPASTSIHIDIEPITVTSILGNKRIQHSLRTSATGTTLHTYDALELLDGVSAADVTATEIPPCEEGEVHLIGVMNQLDGSLAAVGLLLDDGLVVGHAQLELLDRQGLPHDNTRVYLCSRGLNHWGDRRVSVAESGPRAFAEIFVMQDMDGDGLTDLIAAPRFADRDPQVGWPLLLSGDGRGGFLPAQPLHSTSAYALTPLLGSPPLSQQPLPTSQGPRETHGPRNTLEGSQTFHLKVQTR